MTALKVTLVTKSLFCSIQFYSLEFPTSDFIKASTTNTYFRSTCFIIGYYLSIQSDWLKLTWKFRILSFGIGCWIRWVRYLSGQERVHNVYNFWATSSNWGRKLNELINFYQASYCILYEVIKIGEPKNMCTHTTSAAWLAELGKTYILMPKKEVSFIFAFVALAHFSCWVVRWHYYFFSQARQAKRKRF